MKRLLQRLAKLRGKSSKANGDASAERERERVKGYERIEWIYTRVEIRKSSIKWHHFFFFKF